MPARAFPGVRIADGLSLSRAAVERDDDLRTPELSREKPRMRMEDKRRRLLTWQDPASAAAASAPDREKAPTRVRPLSGLTVGRRLGATAIALVILACRQLLNNND